MTISREQRQQAESLATPVQLSLYSEPEAGAILWSIATRFNLTERKDYSIFVSMVGDIILGFYKVSDLPVLINASLTNLTSIQQQVLAQEITTFLEPLSNASAMAASAVLETEIVETEKAFASIQGIRTMANDITHIQAHDEPVHRSNQEDILNQKQVPVAPPANRWETDR